MPPRIDWLSRLLDMVPVRGHLDLRCFYGAPWRIEEDRAKPGEIPYHVVLGGSAVLEDATGGPRKRLAPGDVVLLLAAQELGKASVSTGAVAATVGYQSEAAFQRAFKKRMG